MKRIRPCNDDANSTQLSEQNEHMNTDVQRKYRDDAHSLKLSYWDFPSTPLYTIFTLNIFRSGQCPCGRLRGVKGLHKSWCSIRSFHKFSQQNMTALKNQEIFSVVGEENNFFDSSSNRNLSASISQDSTQELCSYYKQLAADILKVLDKDDEIPLATSPTRLTSLSIAVEKEQRAYIEDVLGTADEDLWHQYFVAEWSSSCRPRENAFEVLPMQWAQRSGELEVTNQIPLGDPMEKFAFKFSGVQSGFYITAMCQLDICPMVSKGHQPEFSHNKMPCLLLWYAEHPVTFATHSCPSPRTRNERQHGDGVTQTEVQVHPSQNLLQYVIVFFRTETRQAADVHDSHLITCGTIRSYHTFIRGIECCLPLPGRLTSCSNGSKSLEDTIVLLVGRCANGRRFLFPIHGLSGNLAAQTATGTLPLPPTVGLVTGMAILNYDVADDTGTVAWAFLLVLTVPNMGLLMIRVEGVSDPLTGSAVVLIMLLRCCTLPHGEHPLDGRQLVVLRQAQKVWATAFGTDFLAEFSLTCDSSQALGNTHYLSIACCRTGRSYSIRIVPLVIISAKSTALFATVSAKADLCVFLYDDKITQNWQSNKSGVAMMLCQWVLYDALLNENHNWAVLESVVDSGTLDALKGHINARKEHRTQRNRHHSHVSDNELLFNVLGEVSSICRAERCIDTLYLGTVKGYLIQVDFTPNLMQVLDKWGKWNDLLLNVKGTGTKQSKQFPTLLKIDSPLKGSYHTKGVRVRILGRATSAPIEHIQALSAHCDVSKKEIPCQLIVCTDVSGRLSVCRTIM